MRARFGGGAGESDSGEGAAEGMRSAEGAAVPDGEGRRSRRGAAEGIRSAATAGDFGGTKILTRFRECGDGRDFGGANQAVECAKL